MIADDREGPIETALKMITAPVWVPLYFAGAGAVKVWKALQRRKPQSDMVVPPYPTTEPL